MKGLSVCVCVCVLPDGPEHAGSHVGPRILMMCLFPAGGLRSHWVLTQEHPVCHTLCVFKPAMCPHRLYCKVTHSHPATLMSPSRATCLIFKAVIRVLFQQNLLFLSVCYNYYQILNNNNAFYLYRAFKTLTRQSKITVKIHETLKTCLLNLCRTQI